jgi:transcriptional regulator with XRE-family HTH domain
VNERIRQLREERGLSQLDLARETRLNRNTLARIELGVTQPIPQTIEAIAGALGVSVEDLTNEAPPR